MPKLIDLTGRRFGELTVATLASAKIKGRPAWDCVCDCGRQRIVAGDSLKSGDATTCGQHKSKAAIAHATALGQVNRRYEKGTDTHSKLYTTWRAMLWRCTDPGHAAWSRYGGRGITVCAEWRQFAKFRQWALNSGYDESLTIDRVDNDGCYEPSNCRWATKIEQARNRRGGMVMATAFGETRAAIEWASDPRCRVSYPTLIKRLRAGHAAEFALSASEHEARVRASIQREKDRAERAQCRRR